MSPTDLIYRNGDDYWDHQTSVPTRFPSRYPSRHPSHVPTQHPSRTPTRGSDDYWEAVAEGQTWSDDYWAKKERGEDVNAVVTKVGKDATDDDDTDDYWNKKNVPTKSPSRYPSRVPTRYPSRIPTTSSKVEEESDESNNNNNNSNKEHEEKETEDESSYVVPEGSDVDPPDALPDGWISQKDPASGRTYYVNLESGVSQWEPPIDESESSESESYELPTGWLALKDPKTGKTYYANTKTGETQWEPPAQPMTSSLNTPVTPSLGNPETPLLDTSETSSVALPLPAGVPALPVGWIVLSEEGSGKTYYVNTKTGTSQWDPPTPPTAANSGGSLIPTPPATPSANVLLPPGTILQ